MRGEAAVEAAADDPVVRVVGLEEERLADASARNRPCPPGRQKLTSSARARGQVPVPVAVRDRHERPHASSVPCTKTLRESSSRDMPQRLWIYLAGKVATPGEVLGLLCLFS